MTLLLSLLFLRFILRPLDSVGQGPKPALGFNRMIRSEVVLNRRLALDLESGFVLRIHVQSGDFHVDGATAS